MLKIQVKLYCPYAINCAIKSLKKVLNMKQNMYFRPQYRYAIQLSYYHRLLG